MENSQCPNCLQNTLEKFFKVKSVPVHSVLLMDTKKEATEYTKRDIELGFCHSCGFITNMVFDPSVHEYSAKYEETQGFSGTFNSFHKSLAEKLIAKHGLENKTIIEIGCGKGDFLNMLCSLGDNTGFGFDPAYIPERDSGGEGINVEFIKDFYSEKYAHYKGDFVCCKMTLEHIPDTYRFVKMVRDSLQDNLETKIFFQIPDMEKILGELGFWDIYYEHCSYFSIPSLAYLFEKAGFEILDIGKDYDDQYLMIETKPTENAKIGSFELPVKTEAIKTLVEYFKNSIGGRLEKWKTMISDFKNQGKKIVLWGGGSKGVAFLTTLGIHDEIPYAVDINPHKHGTFMAGNGQEIVSPEFLKEYRPDAVIVMNPIYTREIKRDLDALGLNPELIPIDIMDNLKKEVIQ